MPAVPRFRLRGLEWMIAPTSIEEFFATFWQRAPLHAQRDNPMYFHGIPSLDEVDGLISATVTSDDPKHGYLVRYGADETSARLPLPFDAAGHIDIQGIYRAYADGYTVVLNLMEQRSPAIATVCRALEEDLGYRVGANFYLTPPRSQGFAAHYDSHDVLIAQIHGRKTWRVGRSPYPDVDEPGSARTGFAEHSLQWTQHPGDVVYLPTGCAHQAITGETSSLHITFGLAPLPWSDVGISPNAAGPSTHLHRFDRLLHQIADDGIEKSCAATENLDDARESFVTAILSRSMARSGHFASLDGIAALAATTEVTRAVPGPVYLRSDAARTVLQYPGGHVDLPALSPVTEEFVRTTPAFRISDLPGFNADTGRIDCVSDMIRGGFLEVRRC
ncbi:cupin domain-containing protein [Mycolicibacterium llatzerense]|uniref:cupin domain-containing protein n=1 Tax=Mycolicibacterium llatzerense TaxID=280871 RepID=UPI0013A6CF53|nr:cupin domain-containing protein [Mycolicibacterium llatzerense]